jgi:DNA-binding NtrC family response regulator
MTMEAFTPRESGLPLEGARVLVVEDDFLIRLDLECMLKDAGAAAVYACVSARSGLDALASKSPTVAILDVRLARAETIAPVARELVHRGVPFIFYTGQTNADAVLSEWSDHPILSKPALPRMIVAVLAECGRTAKR